jgi:hypothetical protein
LRPLQQAGEKREGGSIAKKKKKKDSNKGFAVKMQKKGWTRTCGNLAQQGRGCLYRILPLLALRGHLYVRATANGLWHDGTRGQSD